MSNPTIHISAVQMDIVWHHPEANRAQLDGILASTNESTDIIILPEMFTTGFTMDVPASAEVYSDDMNTLVWMQSWASKLNAIVTGSVAVNVSGKCFNRLFWVRPDGSFSTYDKRHLFRMASEDQHFKPGKELLIEEYKGWKICPLICYDLRFPVWSRNRLVNAEHLYDILIYVANWPQVRREPWKKLLLARAIENQCYVVGVNRVGTDGNGHSYSGDSSFIDPKGEYLLELQDAKNTLRSCTVDYSSLLDFRMKFPVMNDADIFELK